MPSMILAAIVREVLREAMAKHARDINNLYHAFISAVENAEDLNVVKGPSRGVWTLPGRSLGIAELANVDFYFAPASNGFPDDEPYGMYRNTDASDSFKGKKGKQHVGTPRDVPEASRAYVVSFQYPDDLNLWSRQKFIRHLPDIINLNSWTHEMGHLITARKIPSKAHVELFFNPNNTRGDNEEVLGMFLDEFGDVYETFKDDPEGFKREFPTFQSFRAKYVRNLLVYADNLAKNSDDTYNKAYQAKVEKWALKKAYELYVDLSS